MSTYAWPGWSPSAFQMRVDPNAFTFTSPYSKTTQTIDFLGEKWSAIIELPANIDPVLGAAREAFFDRLRGPVNLVSLWNLRRPVPNGTMRGTPTLSAAGVQLAQVIYIQSTAGATLLAGDHIGVGTQLCRVMANVTADGTGLFNGVEILPRLRAAVSLGSAVSWNAPTANFILRSASVPTVWRPGMFDAAALELIEAY